MTDYTSEKRKLLTGFIPTKGQYIAGGAVTSVFTNNDVRDWDVYFATEDDFVRAVYSAYEDGLWCVASSKRSVTFSDHGTIIQFMHFGFFPKPTDIFAAFDFTVCMGAYDGGEKEFVLHDDFMKHNSQRFLRFNPGTRYPLASLVRVIKYQSRGYTIGKGDMLKIALACRGVTIDSWEDLKDQIGGAYGEKVALAGEGSPFSLEAAIESLTTDDSGNEAWVRPANDNQPSNADSLLNLLHRLKGEPERDYDEIIDALFEKEAA